MHVLDHDRPGLAERLLSLRAEVRQQILVKACLLAATSFEALDSDAGELVGAMRSRSELYIAS